MAAKKRSSTKKTANKRGGTGAKTPKYPRAGGRALTDAAPVSGRQAVSRVAATTGASASPSKKVPAQVFIIADASGKAVGAWNKRTEAADELNASAGEQIVGPYVLAERKRRK